MSKHRRGLFIVFEGIDGAGTTTQTAATVDWLRRRGALAHTTREPSGGPVGSVLRQVLKGRVQALDLKGRPVPVNPATVALLFAADRVDHLQNEVLPHLEEGHHVVTDRYVLSSLAYQSVDVDLKFVRAVNGKAVAPDVTFFLRLRPEVAMARIQASRLDTDRFENIAFQRKVAERYDRVVADYREGRLEILDGEDEVGTVTGRIRAILDEML